LVIDITHFFDSLPALLTGFYKVSKKFHSYLAIFGVGLVPPNHPQPHQSFDLAPYHVELRRRNKVGKHELKEGNENGKEKEAKKNEEIFCCVYSTLSGTSTSCTASNSPVRCFYFFFIFFAVSRGVAGA